jgi:hypothetical protein
MVILVPLILSALLGFALRPARRAQAVVAAIVVALGIVLWFAAAHDDGDTALFLASIAGLWAVCAACTAGGSLIATRRGRRTQSSGIDSA